MNYKTILTTLGIIVLFNIVSGRYGTWIQNNELIALGIAGALIWFGGKD